MEKKRPQKNRTFNYLTDASAQHGSEIGARPWGNPSTFVQRLSYKIHEPNELALTRLYLTLRGLDRDVDVYLDSSMWDERLDKKIWSELLNHAYAVRVLPQVRLELEPWLQAHPTARAAKALTGTSAAFSIDPPPDDGSKEAIARAYYVHLLRTRRQLKSLVESYLFEHLGRRPTHSEIVAETQRSFGTRGLQLVHKAGKTVPLDQFATDESLVYATLANGVLSGRPSILLTRDRDLLEQFYKLCWFFDTHYRAMLIGKAIATNPDRYTWRPLPANAGKEYFEPENGILWMTPANRMSEFLPRAAHTVVVECWVLAGQALERMVFALETEMTELLDIKGRTGGLVVEGLDGRNVHPWLAPLDLDPELSQATAIVSDRHVDFLGGAVRLGMLDVAFSIHTREGYTRITHPWVKEPRQSKATRPSNS